MNDNAPNKEMADQIINTIIVGTACQSLGKIVGDIATFIMTYVTWSLKFIKNKALDLYYGETVVYEDEIFTANPNRYPAISEYFVQYVERVSGINADRFMMKDGKKISVFKNFGNYKAQIVFTSSDKSTKCNSLYSNKVFLIARNNKKIDEEVKDLYEQCLKLKTKNVGLFHVTGNSDRSESICQDVYCSPSLFHLREIGKIQKYIEENPRGNFLLHGPPGTGKTSILSGLQNIFSAVLVIVNLSSFKKIQDLRYFLNLTNYQSNDSNGDMINVKPKYKFVIFEDFNTMMPPEFWSNKKKESEDKEKKVDLPKSMTYSDLLNLLSGIIPLNGVYTFWTTNHLGDIDSAFYREGRMNYSFEIVLPDRAEVDLFLKNRYEKKILLSEEDYSLLTVSKLYSWTLGSPEEFMEILTKKKESILSKNRD